MRSHSIFVYTESGCFGPLCCGGIVGGGEGKVNVDCDGGVGVDGGVGGCRVLGGLGWWGGGDGFSGVDGVDGGVLSGFIGRD